MGIVPRQRCVPCSGYRPSGYWQLHHSDNDDDDGPLKTGGGVERLNVNGHGNVIVRNGERGVSRQCPLPEADP